jgi:hypothetical protein
VSEGNHAKPQFLTVSNATEIWSVYLQESFRFPNLFITKAAVGLHVWIVKRRKIEHIFAHSNTGIVGSKLTRGMGLSAFILCLCCPV